MHQDAKLKAALKNQQSAVARFFRRRFHWLPGLSRYGEAVRLEAMADIEEGRFARATRKFQRILKWLPLKSGSVDAAVRAFRKKGRRQNAEIILRAALQRIPHTPGLWLHLGEIHLADKKYPSALISFRKAASYKGRDRRAALRKLGRTCELMEKWDDAERVFHDLRLEYPESLQDILNHTRVLVNLKDDDTAIPLLRDASRLFPDKHIVRQRLGNALIRTDRFAEAKAAFEAALELEPGNKYALFGLATAEYRLDRWDRAREHYLAYLEGGKGNIHKTTEFVHRAIERGDYDALRQADAESPIVGDILQSLPDNEPIARIVLDGLREDPGTLGKELFEERSSQGFGFGNMAIKQLDFSGKHFNIADGFRKTTGTPETWRRTVYLIGPSQIFGTFNPDRATIASFLQERLNQDDDGCGRTRVVNFCVRGQEYLNQYLQIVNLELAPGDCVVLFSAYLNEAESDHSLSVPEKSLLKTYRSLEAYCHGKGVSYHVVFCPYAFTVANPSEREKAVMRFHGEYVDQAKKPNFKLCHIRMRRFFRTAAAALKSCHSLMGIADRPHDMGEVFIDYGHWNHRLNEKIARELQKIVARPAPSIEGGGEKEATVSPFIKKAAIKDLARVTRKKYNTMDFIRWARETRRPEFDRFRKIGAITMNCNPFTWGHYHLIEEALKEVEALYVFVITEDKSEFPFAERFQLVCDICRQFGDRVAVAPSGVFLTSSLVFPEYFTKETSIDPGDSTTAVLIYGTLIAPALRITCRFEGEEPHCLVTRRYQETMDYIIPDLGVQMRVIPRVQRGDVVVSAKTVRAALKAHDYPMIRKLVPPQTYDYLLQKDEQRFKEVAEAPDSSAVMAGKPA